MVFVHRNERVKEIARILFFSSSLKVNRNRHQNVCYCALIVVFNVVIVN